jgi:hypothetical protein
MLTEIIGCNREHTRYLLFDYLGIDQGNPIVTDAAVQESFGPIFDTYSDVLQGGNPAITRSLRYLMTSSSGFSF